MTGPAMNSPRGWPTLAHEVTQSIAAKMARKRRRRKGSIEEGKGAECY
jgi:hypothetical protein